MKTHEEMHRLHNTAVLMLPGFKQAQAQMAAASHVLEYFARFPEYETSTVVARALSRQQRAQPPSRPSSKTSNQEVQRSEDDVTPRHQATRLGTQITSRNTGKFRRQQHVIASFKLQNGREVANGFPGERGHLAKRDHYTRLRSRRRSD